MTLAELYAKLEGIEGGKDLIAGLKSEISKINDEANKGQKCPKSLALEKQIKGLTDKYEASEKARQDEIQKRTDSEISAQTIAALTKANCTDAQTFSKLVAGQINVQDDGSGAGAGNVGDGNTQVY